MKKILAAVVSVIMFLSVGTAFAGPKVNHENYIYLEPQTVCSMSTPDGSGSTDAVSEYTLPFDTLEDYINNYPDLFAPMGNVDIRAALYFWPYEIKDPYSMDITGVTFTFSGDITEAEVQEIKALSENGAVMRLYEVDEPDEYDPNYAPKPVVLLADKCSFEVNKSKISISFDKTVNITSSSHLSYLCNFVILPSSSSGCSTTAFPFLVLIAGIPLFLRRKS